MIANIAPKLGLGLYTISEAAQYARVSPALLSRWVFGSAKGRAVFEPQFGRSERLVSYLDLIQTVAIRELRHQRPEIPLKKFRQAVAFSQQQLEMKYPFAMKNATYWSGREIVIVPPDEDPKKFIQASGRGRGQMMFPFIETYLEKLEYDPNTGLANLFNIFKYESVEITMRPGIKFGEPMLPSGYSATCLWDAIRSEGGIERAAKVYSVPVPEVKAAYHFYNDYLTRAAA